MAKPNDQRYDKTFRESINSLIDTIITKVLELEIVSKERLPGKLEKIIEREADFIYKIKDKSGFIYILHLEIQSTNNSKMVFRMFEYAGLIFGKTKLPFKQFVIYIGDKKMSMKNVYEFPSFAYKYELIDIRDYSYKTFINSKIADEVILAILCNFEGVEAEKITKQIFKQLIKINQKENPDLLRKYIKKLHIFSQLRNLNKIIEKEEKMAISEIVFDVTKDPWYLQGKRAAEEKERLGKIELARIMKKQNESIEKIALYTGLDIDLIKSIII